MNFIKVLRWGLLGIVVVSLSGVIWSLFSRGGDRNPMPAVELLPPEVSRKTTQFEYTEHKKGRPVYSIYADTSTHTVDHLHTLELVRLIYYDPTGQPADRVSAQRARYHIEDRQIEFFGDTQLELADGTRIFSEQAGADLAREEAAISGRFRFEKNQLHGRGEGLRYDFTGRELRIEKGLQFTSLWGDGEISGQSRRAIYSLGEQLLMLIDEARLIDPRNRMDADRIALHLDEMQRLRRVVASGECRLQSGSRLFSGHQIDMSFAPSPGDSNWFQVLSDATSGGDQRAIYSEQLGERINRVSADRIMGKPNDRSSNSRLSLESFQAEGDVHLQFPSLGIHEGEAGQLEAEYFPGTEQLRVVKLKEKVRMKRGPEAGGMGEEQLQANHLTLHFSDRHQLQQVLARQEVDISVRDGGLRRNLSATESVHASYANGRLTKVVSRGDSQVELESPQGRDTLSAPVIQLNYRDGLIESMESGTGVVSVSERQGTVRRTSSQRLKVRYAGGRMESATQSGDFIFTEGDPVVTSLSAERGVYESRSGRLRASGDPRPVLTLVASGEATDGIQMETIAQEVDLDQKTGVASASGQVKSVVKDGGAITIVTAGKMVFDPESAWIVYTLEPRVVQGTSSIAGETVRYNQSDQELVVKENVESRIASNDDERSADYLITADSLVYRPDNLSAEYRGKVRVLSGELLVNAPAVDVSLSSSQRDQVEQFTAWGGVTIDDGLRKAFGDRATHYPREEKIVLTGDPAEVLEVQRGKAIGRQLTFFVGQQRLVVEGAP